MTHDHDRGHQQRRAEAIETMARVDAHAAARLHAFAAPPRESTMGWDPTADELLERASRSLAHSRELIERGRALQERGRAQICASRVAIARSHCLLDRRLCQDGNGNTMAAPQSAMIVA